MLADALPWTIGLLATTTVLSFILGTLLGAFMGWPRAPAILNWVLPPLLALHALPYYLFGMVLMYVFAFKAGWFPIFGAYTAATIPTPSLEFVLDVIRHATCPALSIILVAVGGWALTMRAMVVSVQGEDFITFADAKGLTGKTIFLRYAIRNSMLPQATAFALALGQIVAGGVLVEVVFGYPHRDGPLRGDPAGRLVPDPGSGLHGHRGDRPGDVDPRSRLSQARSAHHLPESLR